MQANLRDLNVEFVSFVKRAAVRDPQNPTEPQRFLLWKADQTEETDMSTMTPQSTGALALSPEANRALEAAAESLDAYSGETGISEIQNKIRALTGSDYDDSDEPSARLAKALTELQKVDLISIAKGVDGAGARERLREAQRELQAEYLHAVGSRGVQRWEAGRQERAVAKSDGALANAEDRLVELAKVERAAGGPQRRPENVRKAMVSAQLEYLRQVNPRAAEIYERTHGGRG
jgi:hypothetical protein